MPTYQYKCPDCEYEFEEFQKITDDPIETCPVCGKKTKRIISGGVGFLLKGSGFYTTDHRSESYKEAVKKESGNSKPSEIKKPSTKSTDKKETGKKPAATTQE